MARRLSALALELNVLPETYQALEDDADAIMVRTDGVDWSILGATWRRGDALGGSAYEREDTGELFAAAARLEASGGLYVTDATWDLDASGARTARTPTMTGAGIRAWEAIELLYTVPEVSEGAAYLLFRLWDGTQDLWWDGADWVTPVDELADWNTAADLQANFAALPGSIRSLAVVAFLGTTARAYTPSFYGARVVYQVRQVSPLDDALFRTLLAALLSEVTATGVLERELAAATDTISLAGSEWGYDVTGVEAVIDLTADPDELEPLAGTYSAGVWTADDQIPAGHVVRVEFAYRPDLVVRRNRDVERVQRLPAVYIAPTGVSSQVLPSADIVVADLVADPPVARELPGTVLVDAQLEVRVIGELGNDVERITAALGDFLGGTGYRSLVSPETGQVVTVRQTQEPMESTGTLAVGVSEARATWFLTFARQARQATSTAHLVRPGGFDPTIED